jgi:hypothetical protein
MPFKNINVVTGIQIIAIYYLLHRYSGKEGATNYIRAAISKWMGHFG